MKALGSAPSSNRSLSPGEQVTMPLTALAAIAAPEPSEADRRDAQNANRVLARLVGHNRVRVQVVTDDLPPQSFILPACAVRLLTDMLGYLAQGRAVAVLPDDAELTTQQAADVLNVSRPHLVSLLERGAIPFHRAGTHRRVRFCDLLAYHARRAEESRAALDELTAQAQELGMGY
jgi:excisionase family DNA binding protein